CCSFFVEGPEDLSTTVGTVGQQPAVLSCKGNPLGHTLVNDIYRNFRKAVDIALSGSIVPAFDCIVKKSVDGLSVILVVLGGVDSPLCGDGVGPSGAVLKTKSLDIISQLRQRGSSRGSSKTGAHHNYIIFSFIGRIDQFHIEFMLGPF